MSRLAQVTSGIYVHPLSYVRAERGWTQQDVVDVIAERVGGSARRNKAWLWENRNVVPDWPSQVALAAELGIPESRLVEEPWPQWLPDGDPIRTDFAWSQTGSIQALEDVLEHGVRDRRGFMKLTGSALVALAHDWLRAEPAELVAALRGGRVADTFVDRLEEGLPRLRFLEAERGGQEARRLIDAELGLVAEVLANSSYTIETGRRLYALAGELGRMAGWASFDAGLHAAAQRYWAAAIHAAHAADDRPLGANIMKSMSLQCYDFADPAEALALARSAYEGASDTTPRTVAMFALREARAHAALGDLSACERLLGEAESAVSRADTAVDPDPAWIGYFDDAEFYAQIGTCYLDLGTRHGDRRQFTRADTYLAKTLRLLPETKVRDRATYLTRRASAQTQLGNLDRACQLLTDTIPLVHSAPSQRNIRRMFTVRNRLPLNRRDARARALDEHLRVLTNAS
ncbi:transcriptional regulator [Streptomyces sp. MP131-18]|uniref:transcriptional regulator n=1 Tax=Streptomyces sp. MP131-18 TaxID=1857892 RepID=UPI00097C3024|nr:transcriptional regulator [Streptomyces sp. MP131-18]ONK13219.1 hypothetical protein STBA_39820 [Streptomyces sp. MP131-18]